MKEFPEFMKNPANKIASENQYTPNISGYVFDGADGSQMAFWTNPDGGKSAEHVHDYGEYQDRKQVVEFEKEKCDSRREISGYWRNS